MFRIIQRLPDVTVAILQPGFIFPVCEIVDDVFYCGWKTAIRLWLHMKVANRGLILVVVRVGYRQGLGLIEIPAVYL